MAMSKDPHSKEPCKACDGSGKCWLCDGTGALETGKRCPSCQGSKKCVGCGGKRWRYVYEQN